MNFEWMAGSPAVIGWYRASTDMDPTARRYWSGLAWSAPVYDRDPIENWIAAKGTPVQEQGVGIVFVNDPEFRKTVGKWFDSATRNRAFSACPDHFAAAKAPALLEAAAGHIKARASTYDKPKGERSMERTVQAFNAITGHTVSESEGWLFMECLKAVRDYTTAGGHADSQEDRIAYAALGAEARRAGK
jgi:hypothetical protein